MKKITYLLPILAILIFAGVGCFGNEPEVEEEIVPEAPEEAVEETTGEAQHLLADVIGAWHIVLTDPTADVPADFTIEGDMIFHADYTAAANFSGEKVDWGTYTYENGQIHAVADNGTIEFFGTITGDSATGRWHNLLRDTWGPMSATRIQTDTFSL